MLGATDPRIDPGARERLTLRFGAEVAPWFDEQPGVLTALSRRWAFELGAPIPRGSVSLVYRCRTADGRGAVLKVSPDRTRLALEAAALRGWRTDHVPAVLALDEELGALLLEEIEPGTPLVVSSVRPGVERVAELLGALHASARGDESYPPVGRRVAYLFDSSRKLYDVHPELGGLVPRALYERGCRLAARLAQDPVRPVLLHGDLTPSNILDGGAARGLVAIDPAACVGEAAFDAVDLILWQADDRDAIESRCERLSALRGIDAERLLAWCVAFAGMAAMDLACTGEGRGARFETALELAALRV